VAGSGICFVCFNANILLKNMKMDHLEEIYFSNIGNYVDMIAKIASQFEIEPKIVLLATKVDKKELDHEELYKHILDLVKDQLENLEGMFSGKQSVYLIDEVIETSSAYGDKKTMEELYQKIASLYCNQFLMGEKTF